MPVGAGAQLGGGGHPGGCGRVPHLSRGRRTAVGVDHDPQRLLSHEPPVGVPHRQGGVVGQHGPDARDDGVDLGAQPVRVGARLRRRDPPAGPVGRRDPAVEGRRDLPDDERPPQAHAGQPPLVGCLGLGGQQAADDLDTGSTQHRGAAGRGRVRLRGRVHDPGDAGRQQRAGAGAGPAGVRARLQRDDGRAAAGPVAGRGQREHLGVRPAGPLVPALADDHTRRVEHDGADVGVGVGGLAAGRGQRDGAAHRRVTRSSRVSIRPSTGAPTKPSGGLRGAGTPASDVDARRVLAARAGEAARTPQRRRRPACCLPSGLSPSVPEFHRVNRPGGSTWQVGRPDAGRGLSPPVRSCTDPGARVRRACCSPSVPREAGRRPRPRGRSRRSSPPGAHPRVRYPGKIQDARGGGRMTVLAPSRLPEPSAPAEGGLRVPGAPARARSRTSATSPWRSRSAAAPRTGSRRRTPGGRRWCSPSRCARSATGTTPRTSPSRCSWPPGVAAPVQPGGRQPAGLAAGHHPQQGRRPVGGPRARAQADRRGARVAGSTPPRRRPTR